MEIASQPQIVAEQQALTHELEESLTELLNFSFDEVEQEQHEAEDLEAGCLSCS